MIKDAEKTRLEQARTKVAAWKKWGPYLSERQWGTVREDYSADGDAWNYFTHDQARSRAYRWGEDGLAGISDDHQVLCFALALWNGQDPILKERAFGLANSEGNHGEDVKEYYFYLDSTPTHSYMKYLYKYPQAAYPYDDLVATNRSRGKHEPEYELLDTGVFDDNRYFDVFVEYAKAGARRRAGAHHRQQPRARRGAAARAANAVVPQHLVGSRAAARSRVLTRLDAGGPGDGARAPHRCAVPGIAGRLLPACRWPGRSCCSPRTRPTTRGCSAARMPRPTSRMRFTACSSTATALRSTLRSRAPRWRRITRCRSAPGRRGCCACA